MKIGLLNDTHLGITSDGQLKRCFRLLAKEKPDIITHAGDYCGAQVGHKTLRVTCEMLREYFPNTPIVSVVGNHDHWHQEPNLNKFQENYEKVKEAFKANQIHFLDEDGIYRKDKITLLGCSGWYHNMPDSNDWNFIPKYIEGDTHHYLLNRMNKVLDRNLSQLSGIDGDNTRIYLSHFPVQDCSPWDGNPHTGKVLEEQYGFNYFISGHSHGYMGGPKHYRTGTNYGLPEYLILEV